MNLVKLDQYLKKNRLSLNNIKIIFLEMLNKKVAFDREKDNHTICMTVSVEIYLKKAIFLSTLSSL